MFVFRAMYHRVLMMLYSDGDADADISRQNIKC